MSQKIRKVIIPVAGYGTRFLPATKAQPKEMLTVVDKPVIQYIVEEAVASGITDVILVTGASKRAVEDHFDYNFELQNWLKKQGKDEMRDEVKRIADMANFIYIRQKGPYGNATPVLNCREILGNEPFAVLSGDDLLLGGIKPRLKQLIDVFEQYGDPVMTAIKVTKEDTKKYGILKAKKIEKNVYKVDDVVEKPGPEKAPSLLATLYGYVLTPDIFDELDQLKPGQGGELWLPEAIAGLLKKRSIYACEVDSTYYDAGSKIGWLKANVDLALKREDLKQEFSKYLKKLKF
ncbi:UTP--glucose-1-phosphate uridylyltransferase [Candidatus Falkowbacteria bacterium RIFOXYB2_FULL_38_15]|uniref:UTP--glucose-1-phosphate uridylyltransferase n=1 Tax=Candidatus Falkowbacteria bacterium RIFOXYA2_FULL_38_12 TaxID=1797993 RepID=A0A1F5S4N9_9BACT|nr:MAG: UTP--glucose-1-phosphate uridylyltransferase [Candidatus Falkowbacteria bacterium RIFOXYA2_FULL_38_12]OGF32809.1 MAG: UTP--glucose-1-phosphate uridylyltransferase [Candidatus Falkowbacteria bacterium RIFOXYB2_FULL_38_15]OGF42153.1 MAG: UTP--glucose-1-phosphate uridylyltransferase [Candidatus Falkowbacteria bacterium RIFOXYD2_FULL_39_16]